MFLNRKYSTQQLLTTAALSLYSIHTFALDPAPVDMGPIDFIPTVNVAIDNNSNIYRESDNEQSSAIYRIEPKLLFRAQDQLNTYDAELFVNSGSYADSKDDGDDNYTDWGLALRIHQELNDKNRLDIFAETNQLHDERGNAFTAGGAAVIEEVDVYSSNKFGGKYELGIGNTNTGLGLGYTVYSRTYDDNKTNISVGYVDPTDYDYRNYDAGTLDLEFFYQVMPNTKVFLEYQQESLDYSTDIQDAFIVPGTTETLNSDKSKVFIGAEWEATANTQGIVKLGQYDKDYEDSNLDDLSETSWEIVVQWQPLEHSGFEFTTGAYDKESVGNSTAQKIQDFSAAWVQQWHEQIKTTVSVLSQDTEHVNSETFYGVLRDDKKTVFEVAAIYNFRRWVDFKLDFQSTSQTSTIDGTQGTGLNPPSVEYDQNVITLSTTMSL